MQSYPAHLSTIVDTPSLPPVELLPSYQALETSHPPLTRWYAACYLTCVNRSRQLGYDRTTTMIRKIVGIAATALGVFLADLASLNLAVIVRF